MFAGLALIAIGDVLVPAVGTAFTARRHQPVILRFGPLLLVAAAAAGLEVIYRPVREILAAFRDPYPASVRQLATDAAAAPGRPIYVLSTSVFPAFPLVNLAGSDWPYRYNCLWPLPGLVQRMGSSSTVVAPSTDRERRFVTDIVAQLEMNPPSLLIIDRALTHQGMSSLEVDLFSYFVESPRFSDVMRDYRLLRQIDRWDVWVLTRLYPA